MGPNERNGAGALAAIFRHRWKVLAVAIVLALAGYFGAARLLTPSYTATSTITLNKDRPFDPTAAGNNGAQLGDPTKWASLQAPVVRSSAVLAAASAPTAIPAVPLAARSGLRDGLTVTPLTDTNQITVTATAGTAADAATTATAVAAAYQATQQAAVTAAADAALATVAVTDLDQRQQITLAAATYGSGVASVDPAPVPGAASAPYPWQLAVVGGLVGLLAAAGAVAWGAHLKQRVTAPPLGGVAELARWNSLPAARSLTDPLSGPSRSAGVILVGLQHLGHRRTPRLEIGSVLVTAVSGSAGALATGLAASAARSGRRVVLVDAYESTSSLAGLGAPVDESAGGAIPERRWNEEIRPWVIGGGAVVGVLPLDARSTQPHVVGAGVRNLVEAGYLVIFVGGSVVSSPVAFAVAGEVDSVLVQVEADPRAEIVSKTLAQLSIAAPAVVAQVVVGDTSSGSGSAETRSAEPRVRPVVAQQPDPEVAGRRS